jgi:hypothetical protein
MNWIKSNPFVAGLAGITIVICAALYLLGSKWGTRHDSVKAEFDASYGAVATSEGIPLYPTKTNREGKSKALGEYRQSIDEMRKLFDGYRPGELNDISPQAFTDSLKKAKNKISAAFEDSGCELPDDFFLGFEKYSNQLAQSGATGALAYQLDGIEQALKGLANAGPSKLIKVYREDLPEEGGRDYKPGPDDVTRNFGFEVTFKGSEASAREFLSSLGATESNYYIVRCLKIGNEKDLPPNSGDAKFEKPASERAEVQPDNLFADVFESFAPREEAPVVEVAPEEPEPEAAPSAPVADPSRILAQVLGSEELIVFVRIDLTLFLPSKELPKP